MTNLLESNKALSVLNSLFDELGKSGYVSANTTMRYLRYTFIIDFIDTLYPFLTEEDYYMLQRVIVSLFSAGDCLLPYNTVLCSNKLHIGYPYYMGIRRLRSDEEKTPRMTQDIELRTP